MACDKLMMTLSLAIDNGIPALTKNELMAIRKTFGISKSRMENELRTIINPLIKREKYIVRKEVV